MNWINQTIISAVARSAFVRAARAQHIQREPQFATAWQRAQQPTP